MNDYAYVEEIDEDHVRVWPLTDSELTWNGEKVLTRKDGFTLEIEMCLGYEKGNPGYYSSHLTRCRCVWCFLGCYPRFCCGGGMSCCIIFTGALE